MEHFAKLSYLGHARIDLDEVPSDGDEFENGHFYEEIEDDPSPAETIPGSPMPLRNPLDIIEVVDSVPEVEFVPETKLLSSVEEQLRMKAEERYGHFHRVQLENERIEARLKRAIADRDNMTPAEKRLRRHAIREHMA